MQNVAQIGATVISLVVAGQVFQSTAVRNLNTVLDGQGYSQAQIRDMVAGAQSDLFTSLSGDVRSLVVGAVVSAMRLSFVIPLVAGVVSVISAALMRMERLFG
jgi:hypothetical protein